MRDHAAWVVAVGHQRRVVADPGEGGYCNPAALAWPAPGLGPSAV